jgi:hypothetical protein
LRPTTSFLASAHSRRPAGEEARLLILATEIRMTAMPWFVKLAITVAVVWLLASVAMFILFYLGDEQEGGSQLLGLVA